jgi:hypothetical protein
MEGAAAQVGVEGGEPLGWWNSWDGANTDALVALGGGIDTIRDKLLAMDEKIGGQGLTIVGVPASSRKVTRSGTRLQSPQVRSDQTSVLRPLPLAIARKAQTHDQTPNTTRCMVVLHCHRRPSFCPG